MAALQFSYQICRDYPYRWFPWVATIGGILFTILFSAFSLATSGYQLELLYVPDPNGTEAMKYWFDQQPFSWGQHMSAKCQSTKLQVGDTIFTNTQWRQFTLQETYVPPPVPLDSPDYYQRRIPTPVLMYSNNILENCTVFSLELNLVAGGKSPSEHFSLDPFSFYTDPGPETKAAVQCHINMQLPTILQMSSLHKSVSWLAAVESVGILKPGSDVSPTDVRASPPQVLAEIAGFLYELALVMEMAEPPSTNPGLVAGLYRFYRNSSNHDISSSGFFNGQRTVLGANSSGSRLDGLLNMNYTIPAALDRVVKIFYSSVLADLGQSDTTLISNITLLQEWADDSISTLKRAVASTNGSVDDSEFEDYYSATEYWKSTVRLSPVFNSSPTTIYTQYQCQVPQLKSMGPLIMAIILTDLVFLRALWWIFNQTTIWRLQKSDPYANYCRGCAMQVQEEQYQDADYFNSESAGLGHAPPREKGLASLERGRRKSL